MLARQEAHGGSDEIQKLFVPMKTGRPEAYHIAAANGVSPPFYFISSVNRSTQNSEISRRQDVHDVSRRTAWSVGSSLQEVTPIAM